MLRTIVRYMAGAAAAVALTPESVLACPVCFGALDGPLADGANQAILVLLGITVSVLAAFAIFFIRLVRRAQAFENPDRATTDVSGTAEINRRNIMEGTA